ncbi:amidohydrolase family protein [Sinorhizobium alkalisoli]|uniref:Amidohydrolase 3 domain-containing protein n=1 Tax=Sinorhizobium alkalisoli TaxID=1752398 RepID=A0A1E3VGK3_9HYPH|nr:amidohydrolase family protein [Sinorhizobium alkalisoli]ODR92654.1 hypothetical protein A8M32_03755 [Sinorhizobium alkalisoli]
MAECPEGALVAVVIAERREAMFADGIADLQVAVHATGDGAVDMNGYQAASQTTSRRDSRHRVEHIQAALPTDFRRSQELGVVASMQPTHPPGSAGLPLEPYSSRIGEDR